MDWFGWMLVLVFRNRNVLAAQPSVLKRVFLCPMEERKTASLQLQYKANILGKFFYKRRRRRKKGTFHNPYP